MWGRGGRGTVTELGMGKESYRHEEREGQGEISNQVYKQPDL